MSQVEKACMRERIAQFLKYQPRNKLVFTPQLDSHLYSIDVGYELSTLIQEDLNSPQLSLIAEDKLHSIIRNFTKSDDTIGDYVALSNWGIIFEPELKFNLLSLLDSYSKNRTIIFVNCGEGDNEDFYLVNRFFKTSLHWESLKPYIL